MVNPLHRIHRSNAWKVAAVAGSALAGVVVSETLLQARGYRSRVSGGTATTAALAGAAGLALVASRIGPSGVQAYAPAVATGLGLAAGAQAGAFIGGTHAGVPISRRPAVVPTVYGTEIGISGALTAALPLLVRIHSPGVMLHAAPSVLIQQGPALVARVRQALPAAEIWWGVANDAGAQQAQQGLVTALDLLNKRVQVSRVAQSLGVPVLIWNSEGWWTHGIPGFTADDAARMLHDAQLGDPFFIQGLTTYDRITWHDDFPWRGYRAARLWVPQVYFAEGGPGSGRVRWERYVASYQTAVRLGMMNGNARVVVYLQAYGSAASEMVEIADHVAEVAFWTIPTSLDGDGMRAMAALCAIDRAGFKGPGRVAAFGRSVGALDYDAALNAALQLDVAQRPQLQAAA